MEWFLHIVKRRPRGGAAGEVMMGGRAQRESEGASIRPCIAMRGYTPSRVRAGRGRLHEPDDKKALAAELAELAGAQLCGLVGHTVILYRRHPETPRIRLPE